MTPKKKTTIKAKSSSTKKTAVKKAAKKAAKKEVNKKPAKKKVVVKTESKEITASDIRVSKVRTPALLRGMKDVLPKDQYFWKKMYRTAEDMCDAYGYGYIEPPVLEDASLFIRSIGRGTDVVDKEMYVFEDKDGSKVGMRPEFTAGIARSFVGHGMTSLPQPVKVWCWGQLFRHDRPQAGRYRQFHQFGCENFGVHDPAIDAETIGVAYNFLLDLGIKTNIFINSIGTSDDRQNYIIELVGYLRTKRSYLCEKCRKRISKNPLRVLDCKGESCQAVIEEAPQIIDWLSESSKNYFVKVLEYLDEMEVPYALKPTLVRGLDYYTETVYEIYTEESEEGSQDALGGGGRYDLLVEQLGGQPTPACGFGIGLERVILVWRKLIEEGKIEQKEDLPKIFLAQLGEQARMKTLRIIENLRRQGIIVGHNLGKTSLKAQLELADKQKCAYCLILGQKEVQDKTIIIRDMESGIQEIVDQKKLKTELDKKLKKMAV
ncbi:MAG: histidine--tRNA ligase [Candidatus Magasanikbacteria bacterium]|nr:histidine--tRNA ligase [Candidatus Magasanikbacteria bacterium]